jgi:hypothetical protein
MKPLPRKITGQLRRIDHVLVRHTNLLRYFFNFMHAPTDFVGNEVSLHLCGLQGVLMIVWNTHF